LEIIGILDPVFAVVEVVLGVWLSKAVLFIFSGGGKEMSNKRLSSSELSKVSRIEDSNKPSMHEDSGWMIAFELPLFGIIN
jgi:hypothetical protein